MTPREFVIWLRGFVQAANNFSATPKQWDDLRDQLEKVELDSQSTSTISIGVGGTGASTSNMTYGRLEDSVTYTADSKVF